MHNCLFDACHIRYYPPFHGSSMGYAKLISIEPQIQPEITFSPKWYTHTKGLKKYLKW